MIQVVETVARPTAAWSDSKPVRVLFIPQWYPSVENSNGVSGTFCREHVRAARLYDDVAVLVFSGRQDKRPTLEWKGMVDEGIPTFYASYGMSPIPHTTRPFFYWHLHRAFRRVVTDWGWPDVVHTQDQYAYYVMKTLQGFGIPFVISQHWSGFLRNVVPPAEVRRFRWAFARAARVLPANRFAEREYQRYGLRPAVTWLPNVLDDGTFYPALGQQRQPWLLHVSGMTPEKRVPDIIRAFALVVRKHPEAILHVVGDGAARVELETLAARELPSDSIRFHGRQPKTVVAEWMRQCCALVLASEAETFGCVLMEAMACGCPVLTTRVGGIPAVVPDGEGLFAEVGNIDQIADGMRRLIERAHGLDLARVSSKIHQRFSPMAVGRLLHDEHARAAQLNSSP